ncbi:hypothetical protein GCM10027214_16550 [Stenotrophomonas tumulicola]
MPHTGQFEIHGMESVMLSAGTLLQVTRIACRCMRCHRQFTATERHGLIDLDGGAVLTCPACSNRQAMCRESLSGYHSLPC